MDDKETPKAFRSWVDGYIVRIMTQEEAQTVQRWYSPLAVTSKYDLDIALSVYPPSSQGFYIGECKGEVISSAVRIPWGDIYYASMYYVADEHRGYGYGTRLREVGFGHVGENIMCGDAFLGIVTAGNRRAGFTEGFKAGRFQGVAKTSVPGVKYTGKIIPVKDVPFDDVISYDNKCFIVKDFPIRRAFLEKWTAIPGGAAYVARDNNGKIVGLGCRRPCIAKSHHQVGPLYSDSPEIAEALLEKLCHDVPGENVTINIWYPNEAAVAMVEKFEFDKVFDLNHMHYNGDPKEYKPEVFAVTSVDVCGF